MPTSRMSTPKSPTSKVHNGSGYWEATRTVFDLIDMYVMRGLSVLRYPTASSSAQTTQLLSSLLNYYSLVPQR